MAQSGFHGEKFRELLHLQDTPSSLIARSVRGVEVAATETRDDNPAPGLCGAIAPEDAYIVSLKLRDYPDCEYWEHGKCVTKPNIRAGATYLYDLKNDPYELNNLVDDPNFNNTMRLLHGAVKQQIERSGDRWDEMHDAPYR